jgi:TonB-dependent starch-binding outer membrane protein SusC
MKKVLGYLVMVCCFSVAKGQDDEPGTPGISLERVIKILKQKGVTVVMDKKNYKLAELVRVPVLPYNDSTLPRIFAKQPYLKYEFIAQHSVRKKTPAEIAGSREQFMFPISGIVVNDSSRSLPAASITLRPGRKGVISNNSGEFDIQWSIGDTLEISYIGYKPILIPWHSSHRILIVHLQLENPNMEMAIVRGYSTKEKSSTAGVAQVRLSGVPMGDVLRIIRCVCTAYERTGRHYA